MSFIETNFGSGIQEALLPLLVSNVLHMFLVKQNWLSFLSVPIHKTWFGQNKTYRGFIFLILCNALLLPLLNWNFEFVKFSEGALFGFIYMLSELPNSFLKRRLGIGSGQGPQKNAWLFSLLDKSDSTFGVSLVWYIYSDASLVQALHLFLGAVLVHSLVSLLLLKASVKKSF
ncbi:MAG: hypothetical protein CFE21_15730 [Bacteroidetes bacterium B1(2017)]|nr:MAG: hypothetical protein CFE21_15730 [Bacteroidetes bacterium B1(2017)]